MRPNFIFPSNISDPSVPDPAWENEFRIASKYSECYLLDLMPIISNKESGIETFEKATRRIPQFNDYTYFIYRGWMIDTDVYDNLFKFFLKKKINLITGPQSYADCHKMSSWYNIVELVTPKTFFCDSNQDIKDIHEICVSFFDKNVKDLFLKDEISSQKYYWKNCSFIKDFRNLNIFQICLNSFLEKQKEFRGKVQDILCFREFIPLEKIGEHKLGMPYSQEFRSFVYRGRIISTHKYWPEQNYSTATPPKRYLNSIAKNVYERTLNNLFTIDMAQTQDDDWIVIEIGDGQVSCIQDQSETENIYSSLI